MKKVLIFLYIFISIQSLNSQTLDSLSSISKLDSLTTNLSDSTKAKKKSFDVDDVIYSSATDSIMFDLENKMMFIYGTGNIKYKKTKLDGGKININFETSDLEAEGVIDTADTNAINGLSQIPELSEDGENYSGSKLKYNFKTKQGFISAAKNIKTDSRYEGKEVKKVNENTFFIRDGLYTTCEGDTPSTYFTAEEMKVIQKDKIFAKWIYMYIGGVPLPLPIPFAVFPNEKGRRSGIIAPTYGSIDTRGQYFRNFGYFFAINDYMDLKLTGDYYFRGGYAARGIFRYVDRYNYNGQISGEYGDKIIGEAGDDDYDRKVDWNLSLRHSQTFTPTMTMSANLSFQSSTYLENSRVTYDDLLEQDIRSNASFSKRWEESGNSLNISYSRTQNLKTGNITEILPNLSFNKAQTYPFKRDGVSKKDQQWYEYIGYTYSGQFRNNRNKTDGDLKIRGGIQHNINVNASPKIGYFNISPRFSYKEKWYNKKTNQYVEVVQDVANSPYLLNTINSIAEHDSVVSKDVHEINMVRSFNFSVAASTKLYGMMQPKMLGVEAFRHTITPSISYGYNPDFSDEKWGYYESYKKSDGTIVRYDPYSKEVFSGAGSGESQSLSLSIGNIFEMKTMKDPTDTTSEAQKITLLNFDISTGYNFAADSLNLSNLRLSYRTKIGELLNFSGSSTYSFYDHNGTSVMNEYMANNGKGLMRLTNLNFSVSTRLSGDKLYGEERTGKEKDGEVDEYDSFQKDEYGGLYEENDNDFSIPWNLSLNYNYNFSKPSHEKGITNSNLGLNLGFNLAKNWKFGVSGSYDIQDENFTAPRVTVYRDLGCWEMNFSWNPLGSYTGYRFEIRMKAPELQDVKVTRTRGLYSGR